MSKKKVKFFFSYAQKNWSLAERFKDLISEQLNASKKYEFDIWKDDNIPPGRDWKSSIEEALHECDFGILLISPAYLGSKFITENELPLFVGDNSKPCIPVMLGNINFRRHDLKGLENKLIFRYRQNNRLKNFSDCNTTAQKEKFCAKLHDLIEDRLDSI